MVADDVRHRLYVIGTDEAGWQSFRAIDTRTGAVVTHTNYRATRFTESSAAGVNSVTAQLTPDGRTLLATGYVYRQGVVYAAVIAVQTSTGARRWVWVGSRPGYTSGIAVNPDGTQAYIAGSETENSGDADNAMVRAFDVASGRTIWTRYLNRDTGVESFFKSLRFVAGRLVGTGTAWGRHGTRDDADELVATLDPGTGRWLEVRSLDDGSYEFGVDEAVLPDRHSVVVTGAHSAAYTADAPMVYDNETETVALDVRDLSVRWHQHQPNTGGLGIAVATAGNEVLIGYAGPEASPTDMTYGVVDSSQVWTGGRPGVQALDAGTGTELWHRDDIAPMTMPSFDLEGLAVRHRTGYVVGTGRAIDVQTPGVAAVPGSGYTRSNEDGFVEAFDVATGKTIWTSDYNDDANGTYATSFIDITPTSGGVFVAGSMDTRTGSPGGTINGTVLRYDP